jgi:predicted anti-sigma-YlaC factor YlaD
MGKCKKVARLLSDALDRPLTASERLAVGMHLPTCSGCRNFRRQIGRLREASHELSSGASETPAKTRE